MRLIHYIDYLSTFIYLCTALFHVSAVLPKANLCHFWDRFFWLTSYQSLSSQQRDINVMECDPLAVDLLLYRNTRCVDCHNIIHHPWLLQ